MDGSPQCQTWNQSHLTRHITCLQYSLAPCSAHQTLFLWCPRTSPFMPRRLPLLSQPTCVASWNSLIHSSCPGWSSSRQFLNMFCARFFFWFSSMISLTLGKILFMSLLMTSPSAVPSAIAQVGKQQRLHYLQIWIKSQAGPTHGTRAGFRHGQAGQLPRGLHNQGASTYFMKKKIVRKNVFVSAWMVVGSLWNRYKIFILSHSLFYIEVSWLLWEYGTLHVSLLLLSSKFSGYIYGPCIFKVTLIVSLRLVNPALAVCTLLYKTVEVYSAVRTFQGSSLVKCLVVSSMDCKYKY